MKSKFSSLPIFVLTGSFLLLSTTAYAWCEFIGGCKLGKYQANVTLTDTATQQPMVNMELTPLLSSGGGPFFGQFTEKGELIITDNEGQASFEFNRIFHTSLTVEAVSQSLGIRSQFYFN
jgi:hypothetical protein